LAELEVRRAVFDRSPRDGFQLRLSGFRSHPYLAAMAFRIAAIVCS
jgi:hypothetical protein